MSAWWTALEGAWLDVVLVATAVLGLGVCGTFAARRIVTQKAVADWSIGTAILAVLLLAMPMPRLSVERDAPSRTPATMPATVPEVVPETSATTQPRAPVAARTSGAGIPTAPAARRVETVPTPSERAAAATTRRPPDAAPDHESSPATAAAVWIAGGVAMLLWLAIGSVRLALLMRRARPADASLLRLAAHVWREATAGNRRPPRIRMTSRRAVPFACGVLRPTVVLPTALVEGPRARLEHVLLHEFAHVARGDLRARLVGAAAMVLLWWHPAVWWLRATSNRAAEWIADDLACRNHGAAAYARDLLALSELPRLRPGTAAFAVVGGASSLTRRVHMLLERQSPLDLTTTRTSRAGRLLAAVLLVVCSATLFGVPAAAQDPGTTELRAQTEKLRAENEALRQKLDALTAEVRAMRAKMTAENAGDAARTEPSEEPEKEPGRAEPIDMTAHRSIPAIQRGLARGDTGRDGFGTSVALDIANRALDLNAERRILEADLERTKKLFQEGYVDQKEFRTQEIRLENVLRKLRIVEIAVQGEIPACKAAIVAAETAKSLYDSGRAPHSELLRHQAQASRAKAALEIFAMLEF